jgi:hypothetical protein
MVRKNTIHDNHPLLALFSLRSARGRVVLPVGTQPSLDKPILGRHTSIILDNLDVHILSHRLLGRIPEPFECGLGASACETLPRESDAVFPVFGAA